jgi:transcriptional regulator GlxA family with amidase domain
MIDIYGPYEVLQWVGKLQQIDVALISDTMEPVTSKPGSAAMGKSLWAIEVRHALIVSPRSIDPFNSTVYPSITPTHTFNNAPDLDVLIIPGGPGMRAPEMNATLAYIAKTAPNVKHVINICTGSALAARAGIMDGKIATTHKTSWPITYGPKTTWVGNARWVEDDSGSPPVWSSSGVTSGLDLMFQFVEKFYSPENATHITKMMEYVRNTDPNNDPFARNETVVPTAKLWV